MTPDFSFLTIAATAVFVFGAVTIIVLTWRNAQPTGTIGQLLHRTEKLPYHGEIDPRRFSDRDRD